MTSKSSISISVKVSLFASAILISCFLGLALHAAPPAKQEAAATAQATQKGFDTPEQAVDSLIRTAELYDAAALKEILGPDSADIITSEDPVMDKTRAVAFAAKAREKKSIEVDKKNSNRAILSVGIEDWSLPIPIVKRKGKWYFDTKAGRQEILLRRIGGNELDAIQICRGYVEAQDEYALEKHDDSTVNQYAQRVISMPGKHDGLAWQNADGTWAGPVGEGIAKALEQGYTQKDKPQPYHGYYFKILKGQGPAAPMGQMDFVEGGSHDRRLRPGGGPSPISGDGRAVVHRRPERNRLPKGSRTGHPEGVPEHGPVQPRQDLAAHRRRVVGSGKVERLPFRQGFGVT